jgi:hypothetical protein
MLRLYTDIIITKNPLGPCPAFIFRRQSWVVLSYSDDDFSLRVFLFNIPESFNDLT